MNGANGSAWAMGIFGGARPGVADFSHLDRQASSVALLEAAPSAAARSALERPEPPAPRHVTLHGTGARSPRSAGSISHNWLVSSPLVRERSGSAGVCPDAPPLGRACAVWERAGA